MIWEETEITIYAVNLSEYILKASKNNAMKQSADAYANPHWSM